MKHMHPLILFKAGIASMVLLATSLSLYLLVRFIAYLHAASVGGPLCLGDFYVTSTPYTPADFAVMLGCTAIGVQSVRMFLIVDENGENGGAC